MSGDQNKPGHCPAEKGTVWTMAGSQKLLCSDSFSSILAAHMAAQTETTFLCFPCSLVWTWTELQQWDVSRSEEYHVG